MFVYIYTFGDLLKVSDRALSDYLFSLLEFQCIYISTLLEIC